MHRNQCSIRLELVIRALPQRYSNQGLNLPGFALAPIRDTQLGFYTYLYRYLYAGGTRPVIVGRLEELRDELIPLLENVSQPVGEEMRRYIEKESPRNTSQHHLYTEYYDDRLRELVAQRDAEVIRRHGYRFGA